jgi:hypothetical protein
MKHGWVELLFFIVEETGDVVALCSKGRANKENIYIQGSCQEGRRVDCFLDGPSYQRVSGVARKMGKTCIFFFFFPSMDPFSQGNVVTLHCTCVFAL